MEAKPTTPPSSGEPRYLLLLLFTVVAALGFGLLTAFTVGALVSFVPAAAGTGFGAVLGFGLPIFLAVRAGAALRRRRRSVFLRRVVTIALVLATQLAITGAILQYSPRTTGNVAWTAHEVLQLFGGVPVLSDLLYAHAERDNAIPGTDVKKPKGGKGTGSKVGPDGGVLLTDGGPPVDVSPPAGHADGGPSAAADAGVAVAAVVASTGPTPPKPKPGIGLSPRTEGKPARVFCASLATNTGDALLLVGTLGAGGQLTSRIVDLSGVDKLGEPSVVECSEDGAVAAILGGAHLVMAKPGKTVADVVKPLEPGQKLGGQEIQAVRDVVIGPGGAALAIVDQLTGDAGTVAQALVSIPRTGAPVVLRKSGDKVPGSATDATVVKGYSLKKSSGAGTVLIAETYLEGGDDVGTRMSGDTWLLNPQRLLVVKLDAPKAQVELVRTGTETSGIDGLELQNFGDAWLLADGRAVLDANFLEKGSDGWLFVIKPGGGIFGLAPELRAPAPHAPWSATPPRARGLEAASDGTLVFRRDDGAVVITNLDHPGDATAGLLGADALGGDGHKLGPLGAVDVPLLARGGEWLVASAQVKSATPHDAIVLASRADILNGKAEVLVEVGQKVPDLSRGHPEGPDAVAKGAKPKERTIQSLRLQKGRDELLWQR